MFEELLDVFCVLGSGVEPFKPTANDGTRTVITGFKPRERPEAHDHDPGILREREEL